MTNRPDKLDVDIKRAGRLDRKIPFFPPQGPEEVEPVLLALLRTHGLAHRRSSSRATARTRARGWPDTRTRRFEQVVLLARRAARGRGR